MQPQRRSYSKPFKAQVIQECSQSGAAIANVALSHNLKLAGFLVPPSGMCVFTRDNSSRVGLSSRR